MDGILNINKPQGWTSHDVVAWVRRLTRHAIQRVGHAGTLDPMATGVLLVCLGRATRVAEYLANSDKLYRAEMRLGVETDTYDAEGEIVAAQPVNVDEPAVRAALSNFIGEMDQVPPMYSALKRDGKPLYKLARKGVVMERAPRRVAIYDITLRAWQPPAPHKNDGSYVTIDVHCSPGTYIRSLAHDIGLALGCGAHLTALTRLASGSFTLDDAVKLADLSGLEDLAGLLHPLDAALQNLPAVTLDTEAARRVLTGQAILSNRSEADALDGLLCRAYNGNGALLAIMAYDSTAQVWRPKKVLADEGITESN